MILVYLPLLFLTVYLARFPFSFLSIRVSLYCTYLLLSMPQQQQQQQQQSG